LETPNRSRRPILLITIGGASILFAVIVLLLNSPSQTTILPETSSPTESVYPEIARVSLKDAGAAFSAKMAVFIDARSKSSYDAGHISGALSIPADELQNRLGELKKTDWIITYCT
jgi:3-mercaptopyruvate sulfurtransferase SseA